MNRKFLALLLALTILPAIAEAAVRLPRLFSNGMVLQREQSLAVWGWAEPGEQITVKIAAQVKTVRAGSAGKWTVMLDPLQLGPALTLSVTGESNTVEVKDVLVGDVFQCSGQSNAAMSLGSCKRYSGTSEDIMGTTFPEVRIFQVPWGLFKDTPQEDVPASCAWESLQPEKNAGFSAMAFYFARDLHQHLKVPIGIVRASHAGGMAEIKMSKEALLSYEHGRRFYEGAMKFFESRTNKPQGALTEKPGNDGLPSAPKPEATVNGRYPASDWNGSIAPVIRYAKRGILWYQGEHNAGNGSFSYRETLPVLIRSWREACGNSELPFIIVQLPAHGAVGWPMLRESQLVAYQQTRNAGFVVMIDHGEKDNIHPADKLFLGERLALEARRLVYGEPASGCGPLYEKCVIEGSKVVIHFVNINGSLKSKSGAQLAGFVVAGEERVFVPAVAQIDGNTVVVTNPNVRQPKAVRYLWESFPATVSLFDSHNLPASPFRTDAWEDAKTNSRSGGGSS